MSADPSTAPLGPAAAPAAPAAGAEAPRARSALREAFALLVATPVGKAGVGSFLALIAISLWVVFTYPSDFGTGRWSNPAVWADNPKAAAPAWTAWFSGDDQVEHTVETTSTPAETREIAAGEVRTYRLPLDLDADAFPTLLSATIDDVEFNARPPVIAISLLRPDGGQVPLANVAASNPRPDETAPYRRFTDPPERIDLAAQDTALQGITATYGQLYPGLAAPADPRADLLAALFGRPAEDGSGELVPLEGAYTLQVQFVVADPADSLGEITGVMGGTVYGAMGTDTVGRDLIEGLVYGFPIALLIAVLSALASTVIGAGLGVLSGYAGGVTDAVIQRACDIVNNVPTLPLLIFLVFIFGSNLWLIILVLVAFSWPGLTILVRSMVLQVRGGNLVEAAQAIGAKRGRIMLRHVFPQVAPFVVAQMIFFAPGAILAEASLSFLGLGDTSVPTWGQMLQSGFQTGALYVGYWWWVLPPGILIILTALVFMLLALAMEPVVDPRLRRTETASR